MNHVDLFFCPRHLILFNKTHLSIHIVRGVITKIGVILERKKNCWLMIGWATFCVNWHKPATLMSQTFNFSSVGVCSETLGLEMHLSSFGEDLSYLKSESLGRMKWCVNWDSRWAMRTHRRTRTSRSISFSSKLNHTLNPQKTVNLRAV